jgi:hypothetical protein
VLWIGWGGERMGCLKGGAKDIKMHAFFSSTDWNNVYDRIGTPPIRPKVSVNSSLPYYHFMFYLLTHDTQSKEMVLISIILLSHSLDVTLFFLIFQFR